MVGLRMWLPIVLWAVVIWLMSQYGRVPDLSPWLTVQATMIAGHIALYACLGFFAARYLAFGLRLPGVLVLVFSTALCATFGIADELHQRLVENRSADLDDLIADFAGGFVGSLAYLCFAWLAGTIRNDQDRSVERTDLARPGRVFGSALLLFVFLPMFMYSGIPETLFRFIGKHSGLLEVGMLRQRIEPSAAVDSGKESKATGRTESTEGQVIPPPKATPADKDAPTTQAVVEEKDRAVKSGQDKVDNVTDTAVKERISAVRQAPSPDVEAAPRSTDSQKNPPAEDVDHLAALYKELADLETQEMHMAAYGLEYPPRAALREKIEVFRVKILQVERRPLTPELAERIRSQYLSVFKSELGRLEVREMHMSKYSRQYPPRALLREKMDLLRKKITHIESSTGGQSP